MKERLVVYRLVVVEHRETLRPSCFDKITSDDV